MTRKIIRLTEDDLKRIVSDATNKLINTILENNNIAYELPPFPQGENIEVIMLGKTRDADEETRRIVWEMLVISYEQHGGLKSYDDYDDFYKRNHLIMIARPKRSNVILSCGTYRRIGDSLKMTAIGCQQSDEGKIALQSIIRDNIMHNGLHYWAEVSGAIEHYFKKHNGFPMPSLMASKILNVSEDKIILSDKDNVHYRRQIGKDPSDVFTKMIFGIKSMEIFNEVIASVENYGTFMKEVNNTPTTESLKKNHYTINQAIYIIENIYRAHEEAEFNELIPSWYQGLKDSLEVLYKEVEPSEIVKDYIEYGEFLLSDMTVLTLNEF